MKNNTSSPSTQSEQPTPHLRSQSQTSAPLRAHHLDEQMSSPSQIVIGETVQTQHHSVLRIAEQFPEHQAVTEPSSIVQVDEHPKKLDERRSSLSSTSLCSSTEYLKSQNQPFAAESQRSNKLAAVQQIVRAQQQQRLESQRSTETLDEQSKDDLQQSSSRSAQQHVPTSASRSNSSHNSRGSESSSSKLTSNSVSSRSHKNPSYESSFHENAASTTSMSSCNTMFKSLKQSVDPQSEILALISKEEIKESINSLRSAAAPTKPQPIHGLRQQAVRVSTAIDDIKKNPSDHQTNTTTHLSSQSQLQQQQQQPQQQTNKTQSYHSQIHSHKSSRHTVMLRRSNKVSMTEFEVLQALSSQLDQPQINTVNSTENKQQQDDSIHDKKDLPQKLPESTNAADAAPEANASSAMENQQLESSLSSDHQQEEEQEDEDAEEKYNDMQIQKQMSLLDDDDYLFDLRTFKAPAETNNFTTSSAVTSAVAANNNSTNQSSRPFLFQPIPQTNSLLHSQQQSQHFPIFPQVSDYPPDRSGSASLMSFAPFPQPQRAQSVDPSQLPQGFALMHYDLSNTFTPPPQFTSPQAMQSQQQQQHSPYQMYPTLGIQQQQAPIQQVAAAPPPPPGVQLPPQSSPGPFLATNPPQNPSTKRNPHPLLEIQSVFSSQSSSTHLLPKHIIPQNANNNNNNNNNNICPSQASTTESERINTYRSGSSSGNYLDNLQQENIIKHIQLQQPLQTQQLSQPQMFFDTLNQQQQQHQQQQQQQLQQQYLSNPIIDHSAFQASYMNAFQQQQQSQQLPQQRFPTENSTQAQYFQQAPSYFQESVQQSMMAQQQQRLQKKNFMGNEQMQPQMMFNAIDQQAYLPSQFNDTQFVQRNPHSRMVSCLEFRQMAQMAQNQNGMMYPQQQMHHQPPGQFHPSAMYYQQQFQPEMSMLQQHTKGKKKLEIKEETVKYDINLQNLEADGRTTVYIKNIPNKYTLNCVLQTISKNHADNYDFFYLPIDFQNKCNVGYAFINFVKPEHIRAFFIEFNDKKWKKFNSDKICNLKYARIQGREQLEEHFENSSVMNQREKKFKPVFLQISDLIESQKQQQQHTSTYHITNDEQQMNNHTASRTQQPQMYHQHSQLPQQQHQQQQPRSNYKNNNFNNRHSTHYVQKN